jgi:hypothetical protein
MNVIKIMKGVNIYMIGNSTPIIIPNPMEKSATKNTISIKSINPFIVILYTKEINKKIKITDVKKRINTKILDTRTFKKINLDLLISTKKFPEISLLTIKAEIINNEKKVV